MTSIVTIFYRIIVFSGKSNMIGLIIFTLPIGPTVLRFNGVKNNDRTHGTI